MLTRERATRLLEEMLQRIADGGRWPSFVRELYVFGSYARGAEAPDDIDIAVEYTLDSEAASDSMRDMAYGRDWSVPFRRALTGGRRGFQFVFNAAERLKSDSEYELVLLYQRGDTLAVSLARLHAIPADESAGRAIRNDMVPAFAGLDRELHRPMRRNLVALLDAGAVDIERIELDDGHVKDPRAARIIDVRWPNAGAARRAVLAGLAYFEARGIDVGEVRLGDRTIRGRRRTAQYAVSWTLTRFGHLPAWIRDGHGDWLAIFGATRRAPLQALLVRPLDAALVPERMDRLWD